MQAVRARLQQVRPPRPPHEEAHVSLARDTMESHLNVILKFSSNINRTYDLQPRVLHSFYRFNLPSLPRLATHLEFMLFTMSNFCHLDSVTKSLVLQVIDKEILFNFTYFPHCDVACH